MNFKIWKATRLHKRVIYYENKIDKFKSMLNKIKQWHKQSKNELNKHMKTMSNKEVFEFGIREGYIEKNN
jgi:hypothetical protein